MKVINNNKWQNFENNQDKFLPINSLSVNLNNTTFNNNNKNKNLEKVECRI